MKNKYIKIEKVKSILMYDGLIRWGVHEGYRVYPIQYKDHKYTVEIRVDITSMIDEIRRHGDDILPDNIDINVTIYNYSDNIIFRNRGKAVFKTKIKPTEIEGIDICNQTEEEFYETYPIIIEKIFELYKKDFDENMKMKARIEEAKKWDGVINLP